MFINGLKNISTFAVFVLRHVRGQSDYCFFNIQSTREFQGTEKKVWHIERIIQQNSVLI